MAKMGTTGTVNVTIEMMQNALSALEEYEATTQSLYTRLNTEVNNLIPGSFSGSAASGFQAFYTNSIEPVTGKALTDIIATLRNIFESIQKQIPGMEQGVDEQLGQGNNNAGGSGSDGN